MNEVLTIDEIRSRYAPDWVLIADPEVDEGTNFGRGGCSSTARIGTRFAAR